MSVREYSLKKDGDKKVSEDFRVREFRCKDGSDRILISPETVKILQSVRDYFGRPVKINSAYRTPAYNRKVGGVSSSQHVKGTACDISVEGVPPEAVAAYLEAMFPDSGIGLYDTFVHIDTRGHKSYWKDKGDHTVSTFGQGKLYEKYKAKQADKETDTEKKPEEEVMTQAEFDRMMDRYLKERAEKAPHKWSENDRRWAEENGIVEGDGDGKKEYQSFVTKEEVAAMLHRMADSERK